MGNHLTQTVPACLLDDFFFGRARPFLEVAQNVHELPIAPPRHGKDELQRLTAGQLHLGQLIHVVQRQQPAVGHHDQPLDLRKARQHSLERWQQGGRLGLVAAKHLVVDRQTLGRLHYTEHEMAGNDTLLGHAVLPNIINSPGQACSAYGGEVIDHQRQVLVDRRPQQARHYAIDCVLMSYQRIHAAQQMLVCHGNRVHLGQADGFQPAQHSQLGLGITQPVEDHHAQSVFDGGGVAGLAEHASQSIKAEFAPQLIERPDVAKSQC